MTRIGLEGMEFHAFHGYYESERKMGSQFLLDVYVELKSDLVDSEDIHDTVNYENIYMICKKEMREPKQLLETVAYNIVNKLKTKFDIIEKVDLKLHKIGVQLGGKVQKSVIEYSN
ncbi:dihydroneopterin aldolase [Portibacter marinus]|uniref:dihydroneopterin aldolase n=1 Tax=Portibacter marinus TaxID=2898660 RepID=UPI001F2B21B9|nr:dihydroneopterin aldolase [Portibacter marinus]